MPISVHVQDHIYQPIEIVFEAVVNPNQLNKFFVTKASHRPAQGMILNWYFEEVDVELDIHILQLIPLQHLAFSWLASGKKAHVDMYFTAIDENETKLLITEKEFNLNAEDVRRIQQQTQGWTDFICSLKAYLYTGINLRTGKYNS